MTGPGGGTRSGAGVLVVACGSAKADQPRPAGDLYTGSLFRAARRAAQADGRPWLICSAEHGLVHPGQVLAPYDRALADTPADVARLGRLIATQHPLLTAAAGGGVGVEAWAPARYVAALRAGGVDVRATPLAGLGVGARSGWLTGHARACLDHHQRTGHRPGPAAAGEWFGPDLGLERAGLARRGLVERPRGSGSGPTSGWCTRAACRPSAGSRSSTSSSPAASMTAACSASTGSTCSWPTGST